jgi:cytochrome c biogenesis protein CcmG/thiol:disulfide interchange protein DsbE
MHIPFNLRILLLHSALFLLPLVAVAQKQLPDVMVRTLDGKSARIKSFTDNQLTVISFWATWCSPCKRELDAMVELYPVWKEKYQIELLAVSTDNPRQIAKVRPMVAAQGWPYVILTDTNAELKNALNFQAIPHTLIVDRNGNIVYEHTGYLPGDELELEKKIAALSGK